MWSRTKVRGKKKKTTHRVIANLKEGSPERVWWLVTGNRTSTRLRCPWLSQMTFTTTDSHSHIHFARGSKIHRGSLNIDPQMHIHSGKWNVQGKGKSLQRKKNSRGWISTQVEAFHGKLFLFEIMTGRQMIVVETYTFGRHFLRKEKSKPVT